MCVPFGADLRDQCGVIRYELEGACIHPLQLDARRAHARAAIGLRPRERGRRAEYVVHDLNTYA